MADIILASGSPRRKELLCNLGFHVRVIPPKADEKIEENAEPWNIVCALARHKAMEAAGREKGIIIAADTVVVMDNKILGKPADKENAKEMLSSLSGKRHEVYTGFCITDGDKTVTGYEKTQVYFRELSETEIDNYIKTGEPMDKAGAYGIQGKGALFVSKIEGDYFNVVGLPVCALSLKLKNCFGIDVME